MIDIFEIGGIKRLPLGTDYPNVVAAVFGIMARCPAGTELVIDGTGVGKPVCDMFRWRGIAPWAVTATAGIEQTMDTGRRVAHVPKLTLISRIQALLFEGRLKVHADLPEAGALAAGVRRRNISRPLHWVSRQLVHFHALDLGSSVWISAKSTIRLRSS